MHPTGNKKPFVNTNGEEGAEDRHVVAQPNKFGLKYNLRKLKNLPYHLAKAGRLQQLKEDCLLNFEFLYTKLNCTPFRYTFIAEFFGGFLSYFIGKVTEYDTYISWGT